MSRIVTSQPFWRAEAATSAPIQPPPIVTSVAPASMRSLIASESASERRYNTPSSSAPGSASRRGSAPVASSSLSNASVSPPASETSAAPGSIRSTSVSVRSSISCSA